MKSRHTLIRVLSGSLLLAVGFIGCDRGQKEAGDRTRESKDVAEAQRKANEKMAEARRDVEESRAEAKKEFIDAQAEVDKKRAEANPDARPINPQNPVGAQPQQGEQGSAPSK